MSQAFLNSEEWKRVRWLALKKFGFACMACGRTRRDGVILHIDHIKPRCRYPELALSLDNLQVLCQTCNFGKGYEHEDDLRELPTSGFGSKVVSLEDAKEVWAIERTLKSQIASTDGAEQERYLRIFQRIQREKRAGYATRELLQNAIRAIVADQFGGAET